jgi:hypothetical protein
VAAVPLADVVPALVLPGVWVCCVDTEPPVGGNSRDGGKTSVLERLGVTGPLGFGDRAGAPLPMLVVDPELDAPPEADDPDEVCESAVEDVKTSANAAVIAILMVAPLRGNVGLRSSFRQGPMRSHPWLARAMQSTDAPVFAN